MVLMKRLSSRQILEVIRDLVEETMPPDLEGELHLRWDEDDGVEVFFLESTEELSAN